MQAGIDVRPIPRPQSCPGTSICGEAYRCGQAGVRNRRALAELSPVIRIASWGGVSGQLRVSNSFPVMTKSCLEREVFDAPTRTVMQLTSTSVLRSTR